MHCSEHTQGKEAKVLSVLAEQDLILESGASSNAVTTSSSTNLAYTLVTQREPENQVIQPGVNVLPFSPDIHRVKSS